jgi:alpha-soluble NSF attachment protein
MQRRTYFSIFSRALLILRPRTANACYKDAADLLAELEQYPQAIARYEQVADHSLGSALTKYSVKEYWLRGALCALAMNVQITISSFLDLL